MKNLLILPFSLTLKVKEKTLNIESAHIKFFNGLSFEAIQVLYFLDSQHTKLSLFQ